MGQAKLTDVTVKDVSVSFEPVPYRAPLKFGGRIVSSGWLMNAQVTVETNSGKHATGHGSMPVGNVWAWPSSTLEPAQTEQAMMKYAKAVGELFASFPGYAHPMEIEFEVSAEYDHLGRRVADSLGMSEPLPALAQMVAASPVDAAIHDAFGRMLKLNSFNTLSKEFCTHDLSRYLDDNFRGEFADRHTLREPVPSLPLYHLVGALDPLTPADVKDRPDDKLPVTLGEWIHADSLTHLKIKLAGDQLDWDVERVLAIDQISAVAQAERGCQKWCYSCDFNEKCDSAGYVVDFLNRIQASNPAAFDRIQYIEQPTSRNLEAANAPKMHEAAAIKPVVIDEALTSYDSLLMARDQGYSGVALKACKGQTESLLMAAAAQKFGMFLCVQDLTCPGASFLHSVSLAARIPGVAAIEGNARQYCPSANAKWARKLPSVFTVTDGKIDTSRLGGPGLGFQ